MHKELVSSYIYRKFPWLLKRLEFMSGVGGRKYLDFGCGSGIVLRQNLLLRPELQVFAVDVSDFSESMPAGVEFSVYDGKKLPYADGQFDIVAANHVFEHVPEPESLLKEINRVLQIGGHIYIETPGFRSLQHGNTLGRFAGCVDFRDDPTHLQPFSPNDLSELGNKCGFTTVQAGVARNWLHVFLSPFLVLTGLCLPQSLMFMYGRNALLGWASYAILKKSSD